MENLFCKTLTQKTEKRFIFENVLLTFLANKNTRLISIIILYNDVISCKCQFSNVFILLLCLYSFTILLLIVVHLYICVIILNLQYEIYLF